MDEQGRIIDSILVARIHVGDHSAFEELVQRYHASLKYYVRRIIYRPADADDVLQEVWITAYRSISKLRRPDSVRAWLYGLARNKALQSRRTAPEAKPLPDDLLDHSTAADEGLAEIDAADVRLAMEQLSPEHREVLVLRWMEGMPYEEIADVVGCEIGTIRSRLHYAKLAVEKTLRKGLI